MRRSVAAEKTVSIENAAPPAGGRESGCPALMWLGLAAVAAVIWKRAGKAERAARTALKLARYCMDAWALPSAPFADAPRPGGRERLTVLLRTIYKFSESSREAMFIFVFGRTRGI
jgi:hypothetical protein